MSRYELMTVYPPLFVVIDGERLPVMQEVRTPADVFLSAHTPACIEGFLGHPQAAFVDPVDPDMNFKFHRRVECPVCKSWYQLNSDNPSDL